MWEPNVWSRIFSLLNPRQLLQYNYDINGLSMVFICCLTFMIAVFLFLLIISSISYTKFSELNFLCAKDYLHTSIYVAFMTQKMHNFQIAVLIDWMHYCIWQEPSIEIEGKSWRICREVRRNFDVNKSFLIWSEWYGDTGSALIRNDFLENRLFNISL